MIVQEVSRVQIANEPALEYSSNLAFERLLQARIEACSDYGDRVVPCDYHPFCAAIHDAYAAHRPIVFSPDMFWLIITQGFANYVRMRPEEMRHYFVKFENREKIVIRRDEFIKGSPENDWGGAYRGFAWKLVEHIGQENHDRIVCPFSTTGRVETAANDLVLMDAMQSYFEFGFCTLCGIPSVTLEGTPKDWETLRNKTEDLGVVYGVSNWTDRMLPYLDRIAKNAAGSDDPDLWQSLYKPNDGSGGPYIHGWILKFFPYITSYRYDRKTGKTNLGMEQNPWLESDQEARRLGGLTSENWPGSLSKVPLTWLCGTQVYEMELLAGFAGYTQNTDTRAIRPKIGWAVRDVGAVPVTRKQWWTDAAKDGKIDENHADWLKSDGNA